MKLIAATTLIALGVLLFDLSLPLGVAGGVPYVAVVLLGLWLPWRDSVWVMALAGTLLTWVGYFLSPEGGVGWVVLTNRGLALFAIWVTAILGARIKASESRLRAVVDSAADGIVTIDGRGKVASFNQAAESIFGYRSPEIVGRDAAILLGPGLEQGYLERFMAEPGSDGHEAVGRRKSGETFPLTLAISEVHVDDRRTYTAILRDITDRKRVEKELRQMSTQLKAANQRLIEEQAQLIHTEKLSSLGLLAAGVAHEINNPLAGVMSCLKSLRGGAVPAARRAQYFDTASDGLARIQRIVTDLLGYARQRRRSNIAPVDPAHTVEACLRLAGVALRGRQAAVDNQVKPGGFRFMVDGAELMQAVMNLVLNAAQAIEPGGRIEISTVSRAGMGGLRIRDDGAGIPPEIMGRVRDPFFTTKPEGQGTGLGLAVTDGIVAAHGGSLSISSDAGGTVVTIWLPEAEPPTQP